MSLRPRDQRRWYEWVIYYFAVRGAVALIVASGFLVSDAVGVAVAVVVCVALLVWTVKYR